MGLVRTFGVEFRGANVEGVALGFKAFGVEMAEGAALGLCALGLTDEAAALGLAAFGPVAAGVEPGVGMKTPWLMAGVAKMRGAHADDTMNKRMRISGMAPSQRVVKQEPSTESERLSPDGVAINHSACSFLVHPRLGCQNQFLPEP